MEAQRQAVATYLAQHGGELLADFQEVESGKRASRPQLAVALACCHTRRAALLVAKLGSRYGMVSGRVRLADASSFGLLLSYKTATDNTRIGMRCS